MNKGSGLVSIHKSYQARLLVWGPWRTDWNVWCLQFQWGTIRAVRTLQSSSPTLLVSTGSLSHFHCCGDLYMVFVLYCGKSFVNYISWPVGRQTVLGHKWLWHPARLPQGYIQLWISKQYPSHWCSCFLWREDILLHKQPMLEVRWTSFFTKVEICVSLPCVQTTSMDIWRYFNLQGLWHT